MATAEQLYWFGYQTADSLKKRIVSCLPAPPEGEFTIPRAIEGRRLYPGFSRPGRHEAPEAVQSCGSRAHGSARTNRQSHLGITRWTIEYIACATTSKER
jgi:hypothetical protein